MNPRLALLLAGASLAACTPTQRPPAAASVALPDRFELATQGGNPASLPALLAALLPTEDPAFVALHQRALANAPDLAAAVARIDTARAALRGARAERLPDISASAGASRNRISAAQFGGLPDNIPIQQYQNRFEGSVDASWDLDLFGRLRAGQRAAAARLDAATADAAGVRLALTADIARAVLDHRDAAAREALVQSDLDSAATLADITGIRARAGLVPGFDEVRARSLAAEARARLAAIGSERAEIVGRLVTLTGLPTSDVLAALASGSPATTDATGGVPSLAIPSDLLRRRPDVIAAERRLAAADAEIAAAAADRFPRLSITGSIGLLALALGDLFTDEAIVGSVGASIAGPLIDFGRVGARIGQREAEAREAFATYRQTLFTALGETEAALGSLAAAERRAAALAEQARLDADATTLARERYRRGLDTFLTVLDAERTSYASRQAAVTATAEARRQRVTLYRVVGGE